MRYNECCNSSNPKWEFVGVYTDEGITGTSTKKRDGFNRMIDDALGGKIGHYHPYFADIYSNTIKQKIDEIVNSYF